MLAHGGECEQRIIQTVTGHQEPRLDTWASWNPLTRCCEGHDTFDASKLSCFDAPLSPRLASLSHESSHGENPSAQWRWRRGWDEIASRESLVSCQTGIWCWFRVLRSTMRYLVGRHGTSRSHDVLEDVWMPSGEIITTIARLPR
jgi:hypothetical protein